MNAFAATARVVTGIISFAYFLIMIPHVGSLSDPAVSSNPLVWVAWIVTILWVAIIGVHIFRDKMERRTLIAISFCVLLIEVLFFALLFLGA